MGRKKAIDIIREAQELRRLAKSMGPKAAAQARAKADKMEQKGVSEINKRPRMRPRDRDREGKKGGAGDYIR